MAQLHFTLDSDFFVGLFSETKDEAFGKLMEVQSIVCRYWDKQYRSQGSTRF